MRYIFLIGVAALIAVNPVHRAEARPKGATSLYGLPLYRSIARHEAAVQGIPYNLVDAVMWVESRHNPSASGRAGEVGLMQIMPPTARLLGFLGTMRELRWPQTNIRLGTRYLAEAWRLAKGDICTTVMKYRAGHGERRFSALSVAYCKKVRAYLASGGYKVTGTLPKATFGFYAAGSPARYGRGMKGFVQSPRTKGCYARVVQPGARFGACIPLSKLLKRGLVVRVTRPRKSKRK